MHPTTVLAAASDWGFAYPTDWEYIWSEFPGAITETLVMVSLTMLVSGLLGLVVGMLLYTTRRGNILENRPVNAVLNVVVNFFRPIPFIILMFALQPFMMHLIGTTLGWKAAVFCMIVAAMFAVARIVEQNLVSIDPGVIEAARAMGASKWTVMTSVMLPEALGPLVLGYTFLIIGIVDMSAMAGAVGGGGLGSFAIMNGYQNNDMKVTIIAVVAIVVLVQFVQFFGNWLARKIMRR